MSDLGTPKTRLILARLELQIEQQRVAKEQRAVRRSEIADERHNVEVDIVSLAAKGAEAGALWGKIADKATTAAMRIAVQQHEMAVLVQGRQIRLLELDEEDSQVDDDIAASDAHIAKIEAEVSQQRALLKNTEK
jgi:hypothetical protein